MIRHVVLSRFKAATSEKTISEIYSGLEKLVCEMDGARNFGGGKSMSPEQIERGYLHGFTIDFESWDDLRTYSENENHKALGAQIIANSVGGINGVLVLDIDTRNDQ